MTSAVASITGKTEEDIKAEKKIKEQILIFNPNTSEEHSNAVCRRIIAQNKSYKEDLENPEKLLALVKKEYHPAIDVYTKIKYGTYAGIGLVLLFAGYKGYKFYTGRKSSNDDFNLRE